MHERMHKNNKQQDSTKDFRASQEYVTVQIVMPLAGAEEGWKEEERKTFWLAAAEKEGFWLALMEEGDQGFWLAAVEVFGGAMP